MSSSLQKLLEISSEDFFRDDYLNCVEVSQILALKPSAMWQVLRIVGD